MMLCRYCGGEVKQLNGAPPACLDCKKTPHEQLEAAKQVHDKFEELFNSAKANH